MESGLFSRKREKLAKNVGVNGENLHFLRNDKFLSWWSKKGHRNFCLKSKMSLTGSTTPRLRTRLTLLRYINV